MQNRNDSTVVFVNPKVKLLDGVSLYAYWHMTSRLKGCLLTASSWVLLVDDDLILSRQALQRLMAAKRVQPDRVYGEHTSLACSSVSWRALQIVLAAKQEHPDRVCREHGRLTCHVNSHSNRTQIINQGLDQHSAA